MAARRTRSDPENKTIVMLLNGGGMRKITIPTDWKVTFGSVMPSNKGYEGHKGWALRIYRTKEDQRAIFTDVKSFYEETLQIEEKVTRTKSQRVNRETPTGVRSAVVQAKVSEWRPINGLDDPEADEEFLSEPSEALAITEGGDL